MTEQAPDAGALKADLPNADTRIPNAITATAAHLATLKGEALLAWRTADFPDRPSADERNLQTEFPMGWFAVCYSDELAAGEVKSARYFATDLAIWRGEDGQARVLDAYCAHYGANMAFAGKVHGNLLECPFHAWRYAGDGSVRDIPYSRTIPPKAKRKDCVPSWPVAEVNGFVLVWYHPDRLAPQWEPWVLPEAGHPDWTPYQKLEWKVYTAPENMADNGVDISHFKYVHGALTVPTYEFRFDGIERAITSHLKLQTPKGEINGVIASVNRGPGQGWVKFSGLTDTVLVTGTCPVDRDINHVRFAFTQPKSEVDGPRAGLARALIKDIAKQLDQDKVILDRHRRISPPLVCEGDGPFGRNSLYYSQFYARAGASPSIAA